MGEKIRIALPDGTEAFYPAGITVRDALAAWNEQKLAAAVAAKVNGVPVDLAFSLSGDAAVESIDATSSEGLSILRHSMAHVMAQAVQDTLCGRAGEHRSLH